MLNPIDSSSFSLKAGATFQDPFDRVGSLGKGADGAGEATPGDVLGDFSKALTHEMDKVNQLQATADQATQTYATGGDIPLHQVMISVSKAELALELSTEIRNKLINAYQELSRMQI